MRRRRRCTPYAAACILQEGRKPRLARSCGTNDVLRHDLTNRGFRPSYNIWPIGASAPPATAVEQVGGFLRVRCQNSSHWSLSPSSGTFADVVSVVDSFLCEA